MTLNELVTHIADELNLTSPDALSRIEREVNVRYKQVTSSIGMTPTRRQEFSKPATIASRYIVFTGTEKLDVVFRRVGTAETPLDEFTDDEMTNANVVDEPPTAYSVFSVTPTSVTLKLNCVPTTAFTLYANGLADASTLSGNASPAFPESFHDVLVYGVCADEYRRKEKAQFSKEAEATFERRLSDLRMFLAKSAYLTIYRGKHKGPDGWWDTDFVPRRL